MSQATAAEYMVILLLLSARKETTNLQQPPLKDRFRINKAVAPDDGRKDTSPGRHLYLDF